MIMILRVFISTLATARRFSWLPLLVICLSACTQQPETTAISETEIAPPPFTVNVLISQQTLPEDLPSSAMLFVFLREAGEAMPLAVEYFTTAHIPRPISITVTPAQQTLEVVARLSSSGRVESHEDSVDVSIALDTNIQDSIVHIDFQSLSASLVEHVHHQLAQTDLH